MEEAIDDNDIRSTPPPPAALGYRSVADDRAKPPAAMRESTFGAGCLVSLTCLILLFALSSLVQWRKTWIMAAWSGTGPALLVIGVIIGTRHRNWGFFFGALAAVMLVLSFLGVIYVIFS